LISWVSSIISKENTKDLSFSYKELESAEKVPISSLHYVEASDKTRLALREYTPKQIMDWQRIRGIRCNQSYIFFKENNPKSFTKMVEGEKHLSILLTVSNHIGPWIHDIVQK
jgi:hypothetical protein